MTAWSGGTKKSIDITRTPWISGGSSVSSITVGARSTPSIFGIEKPHTSASMMPTVFPSLASATPRLAVTDDLPTPPFPDDTAMTRVGEPALPIWISRTAPPRTSCISAARSSSLIVVNSTTTPATPATLRAADVTSSVSWSFKGHPGMVRATSTRTSPESATSSSRSMLSSLIERCSSGSSTRSMAALTAEASTTRLLLSP